jgi:hypothetical protein
VGEATQEKPPPEKMNVQNKEDKRMSHIAKIEPSKRLDTQATCPPGINSSKKRPLNGMAGKKSLRPCDPVLGHL